MTAGPLPMALRFPITMLAAIGLVALVVSACGRRGSLEAPPDAAAPVRPTASRALSPSVGAPSTTALQDGDELSPAIAPSGFDTPLTTSRGAKRGYVIPKDPFILDPLL